MRIAVIDSGLGGLAVAGGLLEKLASSGDGRGFEVVFANCMPSPGAGFDSMDSQSARTSAFKAVLDGVARTLNPGALVIACNTLSALYERLRPRPRPAPRVFGIIGPGVQMLAEYLRGSPSRAVLFATRTTVESRAHETLLDSMGVFRGRALYMECPGLVRAIELGPESDRTRELVDAFVGGALRKMDGAEEPVGAALLCTHFPWSSAAFESAFNRRGLKADLLDPAGKLTDAVLSTLLRPGNGNPAPKTRPAPSARVVSKIRIEPGVIRAMSPPAARISPRAAEALENWEHVPELFDTGAGL